MIPILVTALLERANHLNVFAFHAVSEPQTLLRIPILNQASLADQDPVDLVGQLPRLLQHPRGVRIRGDARDAYLPGRGFNHEGHVVRLESFPKPDLDAEEIARRDRLTGP